MKARVSFLHKKEADWIKLSNWIPAAGELVVYDPDENHSYSRIKLGDGIRTVSELDFFIESIIADMLAQHDSTHFIDPGRIGH